MQFELFDLGLTDYQSAWNFQKSIFLQVKQNLIPSALILCQHKSTITLGRQGHKENVLATGEDLQRLNIKIYEIERGGDVAYHGPGQLCVYPILNLNYFKKDIHWFLRSLELLFIDILSEFKIKARIESSMRGVWVNHKKIASIGIAIKSWITFHGISLNIKQDDLLNFSLIRPCGLDIIMTSMESILKKDVRIDEVKEIFLRSWHERSNFTRTR
jgi:lipoate-protein ligase B